VRQWHISQGDVTAHISPCLSQVVDAYEPGLKFKEFLFINYKVNANASERSQNHEVSTMCLAVC
jgi:hypothetical protein